MAEAAAGKDDAQTDEYSRLPYGERQPRENFDYIQEKGESTEDFNKRVGPNGVKDIEENWHEHAPVKGGGAGWKVRRDKTPVGENDTSETPVKSASAKSSRSEKWYDKA